LLVAAFILALLDLLIAYALRGLLRRRPVGIAAGLLLAMMAGTPAARAFSIFINFPFSMLPVPYARHYQGSPKIIVNDTCFQHHDVEQIM